MPKSVAFRGPIPVDVLTASKVFGSEPRLRLLDHFLRGESTQTAAAQALGISVALTSQHTHVLMDAGVVVKVKGGYVVDAERLETLGLALAGYLGADWQGPPGHPG